MYDTTFQVMVWPTIIGLFQTYIAPIFDGRLSFQVPGAFVTFPAGVYQSADNGGTNADTIGTNGWTGLVTMRCMDTTLDGAWAKALQVANQLSTLHHPQYSISIKILHPLQLPVERITIGNIYTAAFVMEITLHVQD